MIPNIVWSKEIIFCLMEQRMQNSIFEFCIRGAAKETFIHEGQLFNPNELQ
jgi:hypothetical protein